jgi:hypothetical protein
MKERGENDLVRYITEFSGYQFEKRDCRSEVQRRIESMRLAGLKVDEAIREIKGKWGRDG